MQHRGLKAICKRMGWKSVETPVRRLLTHSFPMYLDRCGRPPRNIWTISEGMAALWEFRRSTVSRQQLIDSGRYKQIVNQMPDRVSTKAELTKLYGKRSA